MSDSIEQYSHDTAKSRKIRANLQKLGSDAYKDDSNGLDNLTASIRTMNHGVKDLDRQTEVRQDAHALSQVTHSARLKLQNSKVGVGETLDFEKFAARLAETFSRHQGINELRSAARDAGRAARTDNGLVTAMDSMIAPIEVERKVVRKRQTERLTFDASQQTRPNQLSAGDMKQGANLESALIQGIYQYARSYCAQAEEDGAKGVPLYQFVINPQHFNQSVENLFYTSFLIRDGKLGIVIENGEPIIHTKPEAGDRSNAKANANQIAFDIDSKTADGLVSAYDLDEPMLPTREFDDQGALTNLNDYMVEDDDDDDDEEEEEEEEERGDTS